MSASRNTSGESAPEPQDAASDAVSIPHPVYYFAVGLGIAALGAAVLAGSMQIPPDVDNHILTSRSFPQGVGIMLAVLGSMMALFALRERHRTHLAPIEFPRLRSVCLTIAGLIAMPVLVELAGYYVAAAIVIPVLLLAGGIRHPVRLVVLTAALLTIIFAVFDTALQVPFPEFPFYD